VTFDRWATRMAEHGVTDAEARGHFAAWAAEDRYFPLDEELAALRRAGSPRSSASGDAARRRSAPP
jgi:hypothetical protein